MFDNPWFKLTNQVNEINQQQNKNKICEWNRTILQINLKQVQKLQNVIWISIPIVRKDTVLLVRVFKVSKADNWLAFIFYRYTNSRKSSIIVTELTYVKVWYKKKGRGTKPERNSNS